MPRGPKGEKTPDMIRVVSGEFEWQPRQDVETRRRKRSARGVGAARVAKAADHEWKIYTAALDESIFSPYL